MLKTLLLAATALVLAVPAQATTILTFGQTSTANTLTATVNTGDTQTTITGTNVLVDVTQILGGAASSGDFLDLTATSVGPATPVGTSDMQHFDGSFSITTGPGGSGTNLLSGTFTDLLLGTGASAVLSVGAPPDTGNLTSSVIPLTDLGLPVSVSLALANVIPPVTILGTTLDAFTASISGDFSATPIPEPLSTLALMGVGLLGLGLVRAAPR